LVLGLPIAAIASRTLATVILKGAPPLRPRARAEARPALVRSEISSRSNSVERDVIRERTQAGLSAARARGRNGGRPKGLPSRAEPTACAAETLYREGKLSTPEIAARLQISKSTLYSYLRHRGVPIGVSPGARYAAMKS